VPLEKRRELYKSVSEAHIKFPEESQEFETSNQHWFKPGLNEDLVAPGIISELLFSKANQKNMFLETYNTIDYVDERNRYGETIKNAPKDQYQKHTEYNKQMKEDEQTSHALKPPKSAKKYFRFARSLPRTKMSLDDMAQLPLEEGSLKDMHDREFLQRVVEKTEGLDANRRVFRLQKNHSQK
jgi:hypothetical protein